MRSSLERIIKPETDSKVRLVVIDHATDFAPGKLADEAVAQRFMAYLKDLSARTGIAVVVLAHCTKGQDTRDKFPPTLEQARRGVRGDIAMQAGARFVMHMDREKDGPDPTLIYCTVVKGHPSRAGMWQRAFRLDECTLRNTPVVPAPASGSDGSGMSAQHRAAERPSPKQTCSTVVTSHGHGERDNAAEEVERCKGDITPLVLQAALNVIKRGDRLTTTGNFGLHGYQESGLEGIGRDRIERCVRKLVARGQLVRDDAQGGALRLPTVTA